MFPVLVHSCTAAVPTPPFEFDMVAVAKEIGAYSPGKFGEFKHIDHDCTSGTAEAATEN